MTREVQVASVDRSVMALMGLFLHGGHQLVGIIAQSDLIRTLYQALRPAECGSA